MHRLIQGGWMNRRRTDPIASLPTHEHSPARPDRARLDDVAGLRVMRRFSSGTRATLLLAHPVSRGAQADTGPRLVKVFHPDTSAPSIDVELAALSARAPHVVRLLDVASIETGEPPCLVLEKLPGPALASYLDEVPSLSAGQAVTILAPLCAALQALHDAGATHGGIHVRRIVFDDRGAPAFTGFGRGRLRESPDARGAAAWPDGRARASAPDRPREESWRAAVLDDQRDLLMIVEEVLLRVESARTRGALDIAVLSREIGAGPSRSFLARLETALFEFAPPEVVSTMSPGLPAELPSSAAAPQTHTGGMSAMNATDYDWSATTPVSSTEPAENRVIGALRVLGASSITLEMASSVIDTAMRLAGRRRPRRGPPSPEFESGPRNPSKRIGRRPVLVGVSGAVLATTALLLVLPSTGDEARAGAADSDKTNAPHTDVPPDEPALPAAVDESPSLLGDDPAEALRALSRVNDGCTAAPGDESCRQSVFQHEYLNAGPGADTAMVIDASDAVATGVWGGSALVSARLNGEPASFLLVKGEAGWRVRDVFLSDQ
jgi:serine/threonine protein kinase